MTKKKKAKKPHKKIELTPEQLAHYVEQCGEVPFGPAP
jgi:hypothetical protein